MIQRLSATKPSPLSVTDDDKDGDGLADSLEQELAERFAPVVVHAADEPNLPTNVDWFLARSALWFYDDVCGRNELLKTAPTQSELHWLVQGSCGDNRTFDSYTWRDRRKRRTFYLTDVAEPDRLGSRDSRHWTTYFHAYRNKLGGVTIQYWRFHPYNSGVALNVEILGHRLEGGFHGGDWEGAHVVLGPNLQPSILRLLGHEDLSEVTWATVETRASRPILYSSRGSHTSLLTPQGGGGLTIEQETWSNGVVRWADGTTTPSGSLVNIGARAAAMNDQYFVYYSGLWGSPSRYTALLHILPALPGAIGSLLDKLVFISSGYWGPAFNETGETPNGFIRAWCADALDTDPSECFA
jgi:hypothetical protein